MSTKDYVAIAAIIQAARGRRNQGRLPCILQLQRELMDYMASENPNFDARQFELACMSK